MKDGTAEFKTVDARLAAIFDLIYPVGSVFATTGSAPELGTWEEIAQGRTLQGADSSHVAGSTVEAGLPNVSQYVNYLISLGSGSESNYSTTGPLCWARTHNASEGVSRSTGPYFASDLQFDLSKGNPIYGNSTTVQSPAYIVHFYRRIA